MYAILVIFTCRGFEIVFVLLLKVDMGFICMNLRQVDRNQFNRCKPLCYTQKKNEQCRTALNRKFSHKRPVNNANLIATHVCRLNPPHHMQGLNAWAIM